MHLAPAYLYASPVCWRAGPHANLDWSAVPHSPSEGSVGVRV
jgi:hypothetical protein